jgi:hypothetical protein
MGVADHVLESISGHLSRRMLEHYSHIRIDAKRQALNALDDVRRAESNGNGKPANDAEIETIVEVADDLTSQSRHSLLLQGSPPSGKLLIPLARMSGSGEILPGLDRLRHRPLSEDDRRPRRMAPAREGRGAS